MLAAHRQSPSDERSRRISLVFFTALALFVSGTLALTSYGLWFLREEAIDHGFAKSALLSRSFEEYLTRSLQIAELAGTHSIPMEAPNLDFVPMQAAFKRLLRDSPYLRSVSLLDDEGRIVVSSNPANVGLPVETSAYLPEWKSELNGLRIGARWTGRDFSGGHEDRGSLSAENAPSFIPVTLRIMANGRPTALLIALNPDYFLQHFAQQLDSEEGNVAVYRIDGASLFSTHFNALSGLSKADDQLVKQFNDAEFGQFQARLADPDGALETTLAAYRVSSLYPIVVVTQLQRTDVLRRWETEAKTIAVVVVIALLIVTFLALLFYRRQRLVDAQRAESQRLQRINAALVFTNSREGIMIADVNGAITDVNEAFTRITGYLRDEVVGKNPRILQSGRHDQAFYTAMWSDLAEYGHWSGEIWNRRKEGEEFAELLTISVVTDSLGNRQQYVGMFSNITSIKDYQVQLEHIAHFDALTKLPNRVLMADRLQVGMAQTLRRSEQLAVAFIDLDGFKAVNDTHGHAVGDQLLIALASRMRQALRDGDTLSRQGGDEFVAVLVGLTDVTASVPMLARLLAAVAEPVPVGEHRLQVSASVGVTFYPQTNEIEADQLLRQADHAMYQAKLAGKNRYCVFCVD